ncbi:TolC family protein [Pendulispora brunnea]|uniref:TolC family protein n=1 Tax=Pendulispora brunnea TaxID=2905690 RepID=A0ABZ2JX99_9BACT
MSRSPWIFLGCTAFVLASFSARAEGEGSQIVSETGVIRSALAHNPGLAAARTEHRRAALLEEGEEHRYGFVLGLDGQADRTKTPSLSVSGVTAPESTTYKLGAQLSRHFIWGTDLTLRLEGQSQRMQSTFVNTSANPPQLSTFTFGPSYGALAKLSLKQPLLRGAGRDVFEAELVQARASRAKAASASEQTASELMRDVLKGYWELFYTSRAVEIRQRSLGRGRAELADAAARIRTGSAAPAEALTIETDVAKREEDVTGALREERRSSNELARLVGDASLSARRADVTRAPPAPLPPPPDARERALAVSYELAGQRAEVNLAEVRARTAADELRPTLDLDAYVQAQGLGNRDIPPALQQVYGLEAWSAHVGLTFEAPLDGGRRRAEKTRAELAISAAQQKLEETKQRIVKELENAIADSESAQRRLELAGATLAIAEQQLTAKEQLFRTGGATALELVKAEDDVRDAELRRTRAHVDWAQADVTIAHLTGRLLGRADSAN